MILGCHLSPSKGLLAMARTAQSLGADTFQFFTRNPRGSKAKELDLYDAEDMAGFLREESFGPVLIHAPYTLNPCAKDEKVCEFAEIVLADDLKRAALMGISLYNLHPGSHVGQGVETGIQKTSSLLDRVIPADFPGTVLLETMSGQGSEIGATFEELRELMDRISEHHRVGVCLDTCHVFAAGYDIATDPDRVLTQFDRIIGLDRLCYVHLNDCIFACGSHKDRHAAIGEGMIGLDGIRRIVSHPALKDLPFCLETPHDELQEYADEIRLVRRLWEESLGL